MCVVVRSRYWADNVWQSAQDKTCPYEICIVQPINGANTRKNSATFPHDIAGPPHFHMISPVCQVKLRTKV
jgi:hypothetical protein